MPTSPEKDYYATLGVMPDAQDIVIKAAYRALAQRYHPDRFGGSREAAHAYMSELNEAHAILSNQDARRQYDQLRGAGTQSRGSQFSDVEEKTPPGEDPLEKDWRVALHYYPDLAELEQRLTQFSWKLANTYRAYLLETRPFDDREAVACLMEKDFLHAYFGRNDKIVYFARKLILARERAAARALNEAIRVLGSDANPARVVPKIARDFDVRHLLIDKQKMASLLSQAKKFAAHTDLFTQMLGELGGTFAVDGGHSPVRRAAVEKSCRVEFEGRDFQFPSEGEFRSWFRREVLPMAEQWSRQERAAPGRQAEAR